MAIYVYQLSNGALRSYCPNDTDPVADAATLAANGLGAKSGLPQQSPTIGWDPATLTTITVVPPTPANFLASYDFIMAFTPSELTAIRASTDGNVQQFLFALQVTGGVNLNSTAVNDDLNYLISKSLLTANRATAIKATLSSGAAM